MGVMSALLRALSRRPGLAQGAACLLMALPALLLAGQAWFGGLGVNPLEQLMRVPARWSLGLLLLALAVAPLRDGAVRWAVWAGAGHGKRLADWNWLVRLRRPIGLACFFYAALHLGVYLGLDLGGSWPELLADLADKPFIALGGLSFCGLLLLAATSTDGWMRRLKRNWKRLHRLIFPCAVLAQLHYMLLSKPGVEGPGWYGAALLCLLGCRCLGWPGRRAGSAEQLDGSAPERPDNHAAGAGASAEPPAPHRPAGLELPPPRKEYS